MTKVFILLATLAVFSCSKKTGPEATLKDYIDYRFSPGQEKEVILSKTTGPLYEQIETMSDEDLVRFLNNDSVKKNKVEIEHSSCEQNTCNITYLIKYSKFKDKKEIFQIELKKIAELRKEEDEWKIANINEIKSFYEAKEEIRP